MSSFDCAAAVEVSYDPDSEHSSAYGGAPYFTSVGGYDESGEFGSDGYYPYIYGHTIPITELSPTSIIKVEADELRRFDDFGYFYDGTPNLERELRMQLWLLDGGANKLDWAIDGPTVLEARNGVVLLSYFSEVDLASSAYLQIRSPQGGYRTVVHENFTACWTAISRAFWRDYRKTKEIIP